MRLLLRGAALALILSAIQPATTASAACTGRFGNPVSCGNLTDFIQFIDTSVATDVLNYLSIGLMVGEYELPILDRDYVVSPTGADNTLHFDVQGAQAARYHTSYSARFRDFGLSDVFAIRVRGLTEVFDSAGSVLRQFCINGNACPDGEGQGWTIGYINTDMLAVGTTLASVLPTPAPIAGAGVPLVLAGAGWLACRQRRRVAAA